MAMIRILFLGEITGRPGLTALKNGLEALKEEFRIDYTVANGEGMTNGFGLGRQHAIQLSKSGVDHITGGEKLFYKVDMVEFIGHQGIYFNFTTAKRPDIMAAGAVKHGKRRCPS